MSAAAFWSHRSGDSARRVRGPRDTMRRMNESDGAALRSSLAAATPSRQQLRRSSQQQVQHYNLYSTQLVVSSSRGSTSRRDAEAPRGGTLAARSISSVAAASAPSQQHQLRRSSISSVAAAEAGDGSVPRRWAVDEGSSFESVDPRHL